MKKEAKQTEKKSNLLRAQVAAVAGTALVTTLFVIGFDGGSGYPKLPFWHGE
jgi:hypothetical protein